jgi:glycine/serine hydroxymethyltransferase
MEEADMELIANLIVRVIREREASFGSARTSVRELLERFPLYKI